MLENFLIVIFTFICCYLFGKLQMKKTVSELTDSYKAQYKLMLDSDIEDDEKQKQMLKNIGFQLKHLGLLVLKIIGLISPFILFYLLDFLGVNIDSGKLVKLVGIALSLLAIVVYIAIERSYVKLFQTK